MQKEKKLFWLYTGSAAVFLIVVVAIFAFNIFGAQDARPPSFSSNNMLQSLWYQYKLDYLEPGSLRSLDKSQDNITTSEGQSYTMLRSVWMDDKATFDSAWNWTKDNMQRPEDRLMSWLFGKRTDGSYGILKEQGGHNTASDADIDIAVALLFALKRWNDQKYFGDAIIIIRNIWNKEVVVIDGKPYLATNDIEKTSGKQYIIVNPSYLAPYAYKIFHTVDSDHDWLGLASTSYVVALESISSRLDKGSSAGLPPDWIGIDIRTGEIRAIESPSNRLTTNFSFDALRLPWRFALDYIWNGDERAKEVLDKMDFLSREWNESDSIVNSYSHSGQRITGVQSTAMYGGTIGYFMISDPKNAEDVYRQKLESLYDPNESKWHDLQGYYDDNWAWFGMALYLGEARNLWGP